MSCLISLAYSSSHLMIVFCVKHRVVANAVSFKAINKLNYSSGFVVIEHFLQEKLTNSSTSLLIVWFFLYIRRYSIDVDQWFSNLFEISTFRSPKLFSLTHGPLFLSINFHAESSKEQKKRSSRPQMFNQAQCNR